MTAPGKMFRPPNEKELEVLNLLARGYNQPEIANRLFLSRTGVSWRLIYLRDAWRLQTMWQLCILAGAMGWATVPDRSGRQERSAPGHSVSAIPGRITPQARHPWKGNR
jgi:hypothetical protein